VESNSKTWIVALQLAMRVAQSPLTKCLDPNFNLS